MIRRLTFIVIFVPFLLYAFGRWVVTGADVNEFMDRLLLWVDE